MARKPARPRPVDAAILRLMALVAKGVAPHRMAREVEIIAGEWADAPEADPAEVRDRLDQLRELIAAGVADAEDQASDVDTSEPGRGEAGRRHARRAAGDAGSDDAGAGGGLKQIAAGRNRPCYPRRMSG